MPLRHVLVVGAVFLQFCGVTLLIEFFNRADDLVNCGYRSTGLCEGETALLGLGAPVFMAGILVFGLLDRSAGWSGPVGVFSGVSLLYGSAGLVWVFAWDVFSADSVAWSVLAGLIAVIPFWVFAILAKGFFKGFFEGGTAAWAKGKFWVLEELPQSKKKRKRLLRERGLALSRMRGGTLVPETRAEKFHWVLFVTESCVALAGGVLTGCLFVVALA